MYLNCCKWRKIFGWPFGIYLLGINYTLNQKNKFWPLVVAQHCNIDSTNGVTWGGTCQKELSVYPKQDKRSLFFSFLCFRFIRHACNMWSCFLHIHIGGGCRFSLVKSMCCIACLCGDLRSNLLESFPNPTSPSSSTSPHPFQSTLSLSLAIRKRPKNQVV